MNTAIMVVTEAITNVAMCKGLLVLERQSTMNSASSSGLKEPKKRATYMAKRTLITLQFPIDLLEEVDEWWPRKYMSRSAFILASIRDKLRKDKKEAE